MSRQFVPSGTMITCSMASGETTELTATNSTVTIYGENWLTTKDNVPNANFKPFPSCSSKCKVPCAIVKGEWEIPASDKIFSKGKKLLADDSTLKCDKGGEISLIMQCVGDMIAPPNTIDKLKGGVNNTFTAIVKKTQAMQSGIAGSIASSVGNISAPIASAINNDAVKSALKTGKGYLDKTQGLKNTLDGYIEMTKDETQVFSDFIEKEVGGREALAADLVYNVTDPLEQELDELLNNVEDSINNSLEEIKNVANSQSTPILDVSHGIINADETLTNQPNEPFLVVDETTTPNEIEQQSIAIRAPYKGHTERINKLKNKLNAQTQEIRDELSQEIDKIEALIEKHSINKKLQDKIDEELETRIKKAENESKELQTDMDRASTLLSGLGNEYNAFVKDFSDQLIGKLNNKVDPKLVEAQNKLKTTNGNLTTASAGLNGAKFIAGGLPAGLVVTKEKAKKDKGDGKTSTGNLNVSSLTNGDSQSQSDDGKTKEEDITTVIGVFMDGTGNNIGNVDIGNGMGSYANLYSNVARASKHYLGRFNEIDTKDFSIYIDGIGTTSGKPDNPIGFGTGVGATGIKARVELATKKVVEAIFNKTDKSKIKTLEITFDVFGFSRGAAAARHFISKNSKPHTHYHKNKDPKGKSRARRRETYNSYIEYVIADLAKKEEKIEVKVNWRFAGLYETVSSHGGRFDDDIPELGLMDIGYVKKIVHLTAKDEYRKNFSLTRTQGLAQEISLPGVHSDIGGGYNKKSSGDIEEEDYILYEGESFYWGTNDQVTARNKIEDIRERMIDEGWYNPDKIEIIDKTLPSNNNNSAIRKCYRLIASRKEIKYEYSYVPLHLMTKLANDNGVNFNFDNLKKTYSLHGHPELEEMYESLIGTNVKISKAKLKKITFEYLHWSSKYNLTAILKPHVPRLNGSKTWFEREVFADSPTL